MFLCRGNLGLLPVLRTRGDRALRLSFGHGVLVGGCCVGEEAALDELLLVCAGEEERAGTIGVPAAG
jgi:hypothetical protein